MEAFERLLLADTLNPKRIAIVGDTLEDFWHEGTFGPCQDGCPNYRALVEHSTPGGAANAARQLDHWSSTAWLIGPAHLHAESWSEINRELSFRCRFIPIKSRFLVDGKIVWRYDQFESCPYRDIDFDECRDCAAKAIRTMRFGAVLISDYAKGFIDKSLCVDIMEFCRSQKIPCVVDAKRHYDFYFGQMDDWSILKCNQEYKDKNYTGPSLRRVVTRGALPPLVRQNESMGSGRPVVCVNHVGAGDCFAAHLALGLAHGLDLEEAAAIAHAAGRVYVQHPFSRPPWPHEIGRDLDPSGGKVLYVQSPSQGTILPALRQSNPGRLVFTNGVFRIPHAGHVRFLEWAKAQGDVLVVGINSDESARRIRGGCYIEPLHSRLEMLAGLACVDWLVPFAADTPEGIIEALKPDVLVKGGDYRGLRIPGDELVKDVRTSPDYGSHASDLECSIKEGG